MRGGEGLKDIVGGDRVNTASISCPEPWPPYSLSISLSLSLSLPVSLCLSRSPLSRLFCGCISGWHEARWLLLFSSVIVPVVFSLSLSLFLSLSLSLPLSLSLGADLYPQVTCQQTEEEAG